MESAFRVIHRQGYQAASVNDILKDSGLTRGALYHHFPNKKALGLAALDAIRADVEQLWLGRLKQHNDPITCLQEIMRDAGQQFGEEDIVLGCPLNNLAQEMSPADEEFRLRLVEIYDLWRRGIAKALQRGQAGGLVKKNVDPMGTATFFVASLTGARGLAKTTQDMDILLLGAEILSQYLDSLRA